MSTIVSCRCGGQFHASPEILGQVVNCPSCGNSLQVPAAGVDASGLAANPLLPTGPAPMSRPAPIAYAQTQAPIQTAAPTTPMDAQSSAFEGLYTGGAPSAASTTGEYQLAPEAAKPKTVIPGRRRSLGAAPFVIGGVILFGLVLVGWAVLYLGGAAINAVANNIGGSSLPQTSQDYAVARKAFRTQLRKRGPAPQAAAPLRTPTGAQRVDYTSGSHTFTAFVDPPASDGQMRPAVLFLHGGFAFGDSDWRMPQAYRDAGYVVMIPVLRGENHQPGHFSLYFDEVDDVLAAAEKLASLGHVDGSKVFIAGHSAGGTLTALAAMASNRFKAAASLSGCMDQRLNADIAPFDKTNDAEFAIRSPVAYAKSFKCPTMLYYGLRESLLARGNIETARRARGGSLNVNYQAVPGDHSSSVPRAIAASIPFFASQGGPAPSGRRATSNPSRVAGSGRTGIPDITGLIPSIPTTPRNPSAGVPQPGTSIPSIDPPNMGDPAGVSGIPGASSPFGPGGSPFGPSRIGPSGPSRIGPSGPSRIGPSFGPRIGPGFGPSRVGPGFGGSRLGPNFGPSRGSTRPGGFGPGR